MPTAPYPILQDVLNSARVRLNDAIKTPAGAPAGQIGGEVIGDNALFTKTGVNTAWQKYQEYLADKGYSRFVKEVILSNLAPKVSNDPAVQVSLDWTGYNNGTVLDPTIFFPQDLIFPLFLWERQTGQNALWCEMTGWLDGMPALPQVGYNRIWDWRDDIVYMPGGNVFLDVRIRYAAFRADFADTGSPVTPWYEQPVRVMRSSDSLAWFIAAEFANARGDLDGAAMEEKGTAAADKVFNRDVRQKQRINVRRRSRSGRLEGNGYGWGGQW